MTNAGRKAYWLGKVLQIPDPTPAELRLLARLEETEWKIPISRDGSLLGECVELYDRMKALQLKAYYCKQLDAIERQEQTKLKEAGL